MNVGIGLDSGAETLEAQIRLTPELWNVYVYLCRYIEYTILMYNLWCTVTTGDHWLCTVYTTNVVYTVHNISPTNSVNYVINIT